MKKIFLPVLLLLTSFVIFAQEEETHDKYFEWGRKNALWVVIGVILLIILIVLRVKKRSKGSGSEPPQQTG